MSAVQKNSSVSDSEITLNCLDLTSKKEEISHWARDLAFRPGEADTHFDKHKNDFQIQKRRITSKEDYVIAAIENIVKSIFEGGFVIRGGSGEKVAFFTKSDQSTIPDFMTVVCVHEGQGNLATFYQANGKTPSLAVRRTKPPHYIAYFKNGKSEKGWQRVKFDSNHLPSFAEEQPEKDLHQAINFTSR